jgi:large subunit ribosomal protein L24
MKTRKRLPPLDLKKGDLVYLLRGDDREDRLGAEQADKLPPDRRKAEAEKHPGKRGRVLRVLPRQRRLVVEGLRMVTKHARPRGRSSRVARMQTGRIQQPAPISASNLLLVCPRCSRPTRVLRRRVENKRLRICRRCNEPVDQL